MPEQVVAEAFKVCKDCPARGTLSPYEHKLRCFGRIAEQLGAAACGKKRQLTSARELFPELSETDD